jgi:polysaccharide pyruvyl transferase WcaK-like protein
MSPKITSEQQIRDYFRKGDFDAVIVGSDQVWRPRYSPSILNFYLDFLVDIKSPAKRLAYAASFGVDFWEYPDDITEKCKVLAKQFDAVSVRERSAVELCNAFLGISATWVVDPTLLLEPSDYDVLISICGKSKNKGCVLSYVLDPAEEKRSIADMAGEILGADIFFVKPDYSIEQVRAVHIDQCCLPSVEKWIQAFYEARFIVTDSFHGTIFSILFNKPFIAIGNSARGMARFESLLLQFGLEKRLVESRNEVTRQLIEEKIDWDSVNRLREQYAEEGRVFIKNALNGENRQF